MKQKLEKAIGIVKDSRAFSYSVRIRAATGTTLYRGTRQECEIHRANTIASLLEILK